MRNNMKDIRIFTIFTIVIAILIVGLKDTPAYGGVVNDGAGNLSGYAWGENVGWINFAPTGGGVTINPVTGIFSGTAWGENTGWISFNSPGPVPYQVKTSWQASNPGIIDPDSDGSSNAYGENVGWINLKPAFGGISVNDIALTGYAWGENIGWINFTPSISPPPSELPTAVTLTGFSASLDGNSVMISWSTSSEIDNEGFHILRGETSSGPFTRITTSMIPALGGLGSKTTYTYTDSTIENGKTYHYRLQDIDRKGLVTAHIANPITIIASEIKKSPESEKTQENKISNSTIVHNDKYNNSKKSETNNFKQLDQATPLTTIAVAESEKNEITIDQKPEGLHTNHSLSETGSVHLSREREGQVEYPVISSFSVTIEDRSGNLLKISGSGCASTKKNTLELKEESGHSVLTWFGVTTGTGFEIYRTENGKENYTKISGIIPYFGKDNSECYLYQFTDKNAKPVGKYNYKLEEIVNSGKADRTAKQ